MEENKNIQETSGNIKISDEVVVTIASVAVSEIDGICGTGAGLVEGFARKFAKKPAGGGIKVTMTDTEVSIDVNVIMNYGVRIPDVSWEVQENVKNSVESMTGMTVEKVNIHIEGVSFEREREREVEEELAKKNEAPEEIAETEE